MTKRPNSRDQGLKELKDGIRNFFIGLPKWLQILIILILTIFVWEISYPVHRSCDLPSLVGWITGWDTTRCS